MALAQEILGAVLIICGVQCSVCANTVAKLLKDVPMLQLMQARFILQWICSTGVCCKKKLSGDDIHIFGPPGCRLFILAHATTYTGALLSLWSALRHMPVGEATAMLYLHPVVCGLLASVLLKEPLGRMFWGQAAISCIGVALVANIFTVGAESEESEKNDANVGKLSILISCMCFASGNCIVKMMPRCQPIEVQVLTDSTIALVAMPVLLCVTGDAINWSVWTVLRIMLLIVLPAFGMGTSVLTIAGFKLAPASIAALFMYLEVPSSFVVQVLFFNQVPGVGAICGAVLISLAAVARLVYEARQSHMEDIQLEVATISEIDSIDGFLDDFPTGGMSRQNTLEASFGPYILAHKATAKPYKGILRQVTEDPSLLSSRFMSPNGDKWSREFSAPSRMVRDFTPAI